jgi:hypothetical protein
MTIVNLIFILLYVVSGIISYKWIQRAHSYNDDYKKCGKYLEDTPNWGDIVIISTPFVNTVYAIFSLFISPYLYKKPKKDYRTFYQKLFNINKKPLIDHQGNLLLKFDKQYKNMGNDLAQSAIDKTVANVITGPSAPPDKGIVYNKEAF